MQPSQACPSPVPPGNGCGWNWIVFPKGQRLYPRAMHVSAPMRQRNPSPAPAITRRVRHALTRALAGRVLALPSLVDAATVDFTPVTAIAQVPTQFLYGLGDYPLISVYNELDVPTIPFVCPVPFGEL